MMNKTGIQSKLLLTAVALLTLGFYTSAYGETGSATITGVKGGGSFDNGNGSQAIEEGAKLAPGATISTTPDSAITMDLGDAGSIEVQGGTTLVIERLNSERSGGGIIIDVQLDLRTGSLTGAVNKFSSPLSKYEIKVPTGVVGIDATEGPASFFISAPDDINIITGSSVFVYTRDGVVRSVRVGGNQMFNSNTDTAVVIPPAKLDTLPNPPTAPVPPQVVQAAPTPFNFFISPAKGE
jgi:hypothetical protein